MTVTLSLLATVAAQAVNLGSITDLNSIQIKTPKTFALNWYTYTPGIKPGFVYLTVQGGDITRDAVDTSVFDQCVLSITAKNFDIQRIPAQSILDLHLVSVKLNRKQTCIDSAQWAGNVYSPATATSTSQNIIADVTMDCAIGMFRHAPLTKQGVLEIIGNNVVREQTSTTSQDF